MTALLAVGALFMVGGVLIRPRARAVEVRTWGAVAQSWSGSALGDPAWLCTVEFRDTSGHLCRFQPPLTSARQRRVGTPVRVAYSPTNPEATARKTDGLDGSLHWWLIGLGAALVLVGAVRPLFG